MGCPIWVDMNPLKILARLCKRIDPRLINKQPIAWTELLSDRSEHICARTKKKIVIHLTSFT
jgi:hypothetical protein